jgi:hypothetical protein
MPAWHPGKPRLGPPRAGVRNAPLTATALTPRRPCGRTESPGAGAVVGAKYHRTAPPSLRFAKAPLSGPGEVYIVLSRSGVKDYFPQMRNRHPEVRGAQAPSLEGWQPAIEGPSPFEARRRNAASHLRVTDWELSLRGAAEAIQIVLGLDSGLLRPASASPRSPRNDGTAFAGAGSYARNFSKMT